MDSSIHTNYIRSGGATILIFTWMKRRHLSLRHALNDHLDHGGATRHHDMAYKSLRMSASHITLYLKEVVEAAGFFAEET